MNLQKKNLLVILISILIIGSTIFLFLGLNLKDNKSKNNYKNFVIEDINLKYGESIKVDSLYNFKLEITNIKIDNKNIAYIENNIIYTKSCGETNLTIVGNYQKNKYTSSCKISVTASISDLNLNFNNSTTLYLLDKNKYEAYDNQIYDYTIFHSDYNVDIEIVDNNILNFDSVANKFYAKSCGTTNVIFISTDEPTYSETVLFSVKLPPLSIDSQEEISLNKGESIDITLLYSINYYYDLPTLKFDSTKIYANLNNNNLNIIAKEIGECYINIFYDEKCIKQIKITINQIILPKLIAICNNNNYTSELIEINTHTFTLSFSLENYEFTNYKIIDKNLNLTKIMDNYYIAEVSKDGEFYINLIFDNEFTYTIIFNIST